MYLQELSSSLKQIHANQTPRKADRNGGKKGARIIVETNMLRLIFHENFRTNVTHYDVIIEPDRPKFLFRAVFEEFRRKHFPERFPAFDGKKNAYSAGDLPFGDNSKEEEIQVYDVESAKTRTFTICLKKAALLDLSWLKNLTYSSIVNEKQEKCVQALNIILRHDSANKYVTIGRSIFPPPEKGRIASLSNGMVLWVGVFQSVVIGLKPYLNVDVVHKGFSTQQPVIHLMSELCNNSKFDGRSQNISPILVQLNLEKINKYLKGLKVQYAIPGQPGSKRTYRVNGLVTCARSNQFRLTNGTLCTVEQYFLRVKKYRIQYPDLPCLWVGARDRNVYLPAELCVIIAGQVTQKKLDETKTAKMIREASTNTTTRKQKIKDAFAKIDLNNQPTLTNEFHFFVRGEFEKVQARVLEPPMLQYNERQITVRKGAWKAQEFLRPCVLPENSWTILNLDKCVYDRDLYDFHDKLQFGGKSLKVTIGKALTPFTNLSMQNDLKRLNRYFEDKKKQNIRLVIVIIPNTENAYSTVKRISELYVIGGVLTQCIKSRTLKIMNDATITNILLKINSKLNGINHSIAPSYCPPCLTVPCIIIGADVTHPPPDSTNTPSVAAVAASFDPVAFQYNIELRLQSPREEMIRDLEEIMISQLKFFYMKTRYKPRKLIFYRDGVGEGQLKQVMHYELSAIKRAIARLEKSDERRIAITFLVVQKRHHVRFFPTDQKNSDDRNFNVQAGTIVDTEITHPNQIDFYLVSHASIQGTARPTRYRCICDENEMSEDEIEQLTYYLCHMFARCTRSVSYPAPTYYAHLAAFRAKSLIENVPVNINNLKMEQQAKMTLQISKSSPMFFV